MAPVAKKSFGKATTGWRKRALRSYQYGLAQGELVLAGSQEALDSWKAPAEYGDTKDLLICAVDHGDVDESLMTRDALFAARDYHKAELAELPISALSLSEGDPAINTETLNI